VALDDRINEQRNDAGHLDAKDLDSIRGEIGKQSDSRDQEGFSSYISCHESQMFECQREPKTVHHTDRRRYDGNRDELADNDPGRLRCKLLALKIQHRVEQHNGDDVIENAFTEDAGVELWLGVEIDDGDRCHNVR
jgi:hypothetical protein